MAAYTLAQANADGCNLGASCESQNPYNKKSDYGTSDLNERHVFSVAFTAASPYNKSPNKLVSTVAGGWALNGIVQITSGQPYTVTTGGGCRECWLLQPGTSEPGRQPEQQRPSQSYRDSMVQPAVLHAAGGVHVRQ